MKLKLARDSFSMLGFQVIILAKRVSHTGKVAL